MNRFATKKTLLFSIAGCKSDTSVGIVFKTLKRGVGGEGRHH